jgi:hypothetical protein
VLTLYLCAFEDTRRSRIKKQEIHSRQTIIHRGDLEQAMISRILMFHNCNETVIWEDYHF